MTKVFIDGSAGTTGLRIEERLAGRSDIELIRLPETLRKDPGARKDALQAAAIAFLCLPDAAAEESVRLAQGSDTVIIDTSTAHRTAEGWVYGFPELTGQKEKIRLSKRIANPGCHASGFVSLIRPLTECGLLTYGEKLSCFSLTGYSGGGKSMIADYADPAREAALQAPRLYGLSQQHKHLKEMAKIGGVEVPPVFMPVVSSYYAGMQVIVPLFKEQVRGSLSDIREAYKSYYTGRIVRFAEAPEENGFLSAGSFSGRDDMQISVFGNEDRITLVSRFDNLGKGASGAAIQNMNTVLGLDETEGLNIGE